MLASKQVSECPMEPNMQSGSLTKGDRCRCAQYHRGSETGMRRCDSRGFYQLVMVRAPLTKGCARARAAARPGGVE